MRILVGVDGSDAAVRATKFAAGLALKCDAELWLAYVTDGISPDELESFIRAEHVSPGDFLSLRSALVLQAEDAAREVGAMRIQTQSLYGDAAEQLLGLVAAEQLDAIVVGKRGRSRLAGLLLGSVSQKLVSLACCPVIVVP
jgi:nucleotide-binding universal stress UspA family protein